MCLFVKYARSTDLYRQLCRVPGTRDGNLLEATDDAIAEAQVEFLRWALRLAGAGTVIEVGTHKGMFGYLLSLVCHGIEMHTIDSNPAAGQAVEILNRGQDNVRC